MDHLPFWSSILQRHHDASAGSGDFYWSPTTWKSLLLWAGAVLVTNTKQVHLLAFVFENVSSQRLTLWTAELSTRKAEGITFLILYWSPKKQRKLKPLLANASVPPVITCSLALFLGFGMSFLKWCHWTREISTLRYKSTRAKGSESNPTAP